MSSDISLMKARDIDSLFYALMDDVICATEIWHERGDAFSHRLYVRTVFAVMEGLVRVMKSAAVLCDERNTPPVLSYEEMIALKEEEVQVEHDGKVKRKKKKISFLPNFQFALYTYAKVRGETVHLDKGDGWRNLQDAIRIRDRLTHPHTVQELQLSRQDMEKVEEGVRFFREATAQVLH